VLDSTPMSEARAKVGRGVLEGNATTSRPHPGSPADDALGDLSRMLASVLGSLALVRRGLSHRIASSQPRDLHAHLRDAMEAGELAARLVLELRHPSPPTPVCSLASALDQAIAVAGPYVTPPASITRSYVEGPVVAVHPTALVRVLSNLLLNAIQATDPERLRNEIRVSTRERGSHVEVVVEDRGTGMPPAVLDELRSDATQRGEPEVGLGLASTLHLLDVCGGVLSYESEPGRGTTATVELPLVTHATGNP
jgi:signal transduction histidine kinase